MPHPVSRPRLRPLLLALPLLVGVTGCSDIYWDRRDAVSFHAGDAQASNKVAQMIDPWPARSADRDIPADGQRMQRAIERYRTNRTTPLVTTNTSSAQYVPLVAPVSGGGSAQ